MFGFGEKSKDVEHVQQEEEKKSLWENVDEDDDGFLIRCKVPGGHIYRWCSNGEDRREDGYVFVPNEK